MNLRHSRRAMLDTLLKHLPMVRLSVGALAALALMGCSGLIDGGDEDVTPEEQAARQLYLTKAKPVFDTTCASCHSGSDPTVAFLQGANPLRRILEESVDFGRLNAAPIKLFVTATNVRTGHGRIFRNGDLSPDALLASARGPYAIVAVPLLFESGGYLERVARVLVVDCPESLQASRVAARSGLAPEEVRRIMDSQWPRWRRLQMADDVVWNGGDIASLQAQCERIHAIYVGNAPRVAPQSPPIHGGAE